MQATVCTVTGNSLYINGYYDRDLNDEEVAEFQDYETKYHEFLAKVKEIHRRREKEDLLMARASRSYDSFYPRFKRDTEPEPAKDDTEAKMARSMKPPIDTAPLDITNEKSMTPTPNNMNDITMDDTPTPPPKPSFCRRPISTPIVYGGMCMVLNNRVYIRDQVVRNLTEEEIKAVDDFHKKQEEYADKWRAVMGLRMDEFSMESRWGRRYGGYGGMSAGMSHQDSGAQQNQPDNRSPRDDLGMGMPTNSVEQPQEPDVDDLMLPEEPQPPPICTVIF